MKKTKLRKVLVLAALAALLPATSWAAPVGEGRRMHPSPQAIAACEGKSAGDAVQFSNRRGQTVQAICRRMDENLVAMPDARPGKGRGGGRDDGRHLQRLAAALQLSEAQLQQVQTILESQRQLTGPLQAEIREERANLRTAIHSGTADEQMIRTQVAAQAQHKADLMVARAGAWRQIHALLSDEQRTLAEEFGAFRGGQGKGQGWRCQEGLGRRK
jgi:Spy/CpxP family protein refolding chaperone